MAVLVTRAKFYPEYQQKSGVSVFTFLQLQGAFFKWALFTVLSLSQTPRSKTSVSVNKRLI